MLLESSATGSVQGRGCIWPLDPELPLTALDLGQVTQLLPASFPHLQNRDANNIFYLIVDFVGLNDRMQAKRWGEQSRSSVVMGVEAINDNNGNNYYIITITVIIIITI